MRLIPHLLATSLAFTLFARPVAAQHGSAPTIPQVARTAGQFGTLLAAVEAAGLSETLLGRGPFTLLAPTDEAFNRLPAGTVKDLLKPENREKLRTILTYHVIPGRFPASEAAQQRASATVAGPAVRISKSGSDLRFNDATVRIADIPASNGLVHVIDRVLLPPDAPATGAGSALAVLNLAIERGVPLFNDGQPDATAAIYEVAATALVAPGSGVPDEVRQALRRALDRRERNARDRAWALRAGLDEARKALEGRMGA